MPNYSSRLQLEIMFGCVNIQKWADLDGKNNSNDVEERINFYLDQAEEYINSRLVNGKYAIPFVSVPKFITYLTTMCAGIYLYDGRQVRDSENTDQVSRHRKMFKTYIRQLVAGQILLLDLMSGEPLEFQSETAPHPVCFETSDNPNRVLESSVTDTGDTV